MYPIVALAEAAGAKVETIRYYERIGLLPEPGRTRSNYRSYSEVHLGRLSFIRRARDLGFTLDQSRELPELAESRNSNCGTVDAIGQDHLHDVERKIADLKALRRELCDLIGQCQKGAIAERRIIGALSPR